MGNDRDHRGWQANHEGKEQRRSGNDGAEKLVSKGVQDFRFKIQVAKILHQFWGQGAAAFPHVEARAAWEAALPGWELHLWDAASAVAEFPDLEDAFPRCVTYATKADLTLARAMGRFGGLMTGAESRPVNAAGLRDRLAVDRGFIVSHHQQDQGRLQFSCFAFAPRPGLPFFPRLAALQMRHGGACLPCGNAARATGPVAWGAAWRDGEGLEIIDDRTAFVRRWDDKATHYPNAWVDPGYAASWRCKSPLDDCGKCW